MEAKAAAKLSARSLLHTDLYINFSKSLPIKTLNQGIQRILKLPLFLWETGSTRTQLSSHSSRGWVLLQEAFPQSLCFNTHGTCTQNKCRENTLLSKGTFFHVPWKPTKHISNTPLAVSRSHSYPTELIENMQDNYKLLRISTNPSILQPAYFQPCICLLKAHHIQPVCPEGLPASQHKHHTEILS